MNLHSPAPSSGRGTAARRTAERLGGTPYMSGKQIQAYLLARDAVRRVQRASLTVGAISHRAASNFSSAQGDHQRSH